MQLSSRNIAALLLLGERVDDVECGENYSSSVMFG